MSLTIEQTLAVASLLLLVSLGASKLSARFGIPALLLFLGVGMLAGSEGPGGIYFDDPGVAQFLSVTALAFILFSGGLDTEVADIRPVLGKGAILATLGVLITALVVGAVVSMAGLGFSLQESMLVGAIVSSTDAAAVFAILRSKGVGLKEGLKPLLELESGSNDPMAIFLTVGVIELVKDPTLSVLSLIPLFVQQMVLGALFGYIGGRLLVMLINRLNLAYDGLYPVVTVAAVLFIYGVTGALGGSGFLAVYIAGIVAGEYSFIHKRTLISFHDGLGWLMQIVIFVTLGLLVFPSELASIADRGLLIAGGLIVLARPLAVFLTTILTDLSLREKLFVSWVGLRGAAPILLATFPLVAGVGQAATIFNIVFFVVLTSVLIQGTTLPLVARWLGVDEPIKQRSIPPLEVVPGTNIQSRLQEITVSERSGLAGRAIVSANIPEAALIVLLGRDGEFLIPRGSTVLHAGDTLLVLSDDETLERVRAMLEGEGAGDQHVPQEAAG